MKNIVILTIALTLLFPCSFQSKAQVGIKSSIEHCYDINDLLPADVEVKGASQGMAVCGRYGFFFHDKGQVVIMDLKKQKFVSTFVVPGLEKAHCNNACFTKEKWSKDSRFPLLYLTECAGSSRCYVLDIDFDSAKVVQEIFYDGAAYWTIFDWNVDVEGGYIYTRGKTEKTWETPPEKHSDWCHYILFQRFRLPEKSDFSADGEVHLSDDDILDSFDVPDFVFGQGGYIRKGVLYTGEGAPSAGICRIHAIDMDGHKAIEIADITDMKIEPEGFGWRKGWILASFHTPKQPRHNQVYRFRPLK